MNVDELHRDYKVAEQMWQHHLEELYMAVRNKRNLQVIEYQAEMVEKYERQKIAVYQALHKARNEERTKEHDDQQPRGRYRLYP